MCGGRLKDRLDYGGRGGRVPRGMDGAPWGHPSGLQSCSTGALVHHLVPRLPPVGTWCLLEVQVIEAVKTSCFGNF